MRKVKPGHQLSKHANTKLSPYNFFHIKYNTYVQNYCEFYIVLLNILYKQYLVSIFF